jgi:RNA polymerase sigma factor (sigma-70 family)
LLEKLQDFTNQIEAARFGSKQAMAFLLKEYDQLLSATARRYGSGGLHADAYQEACIAFLEAISEWQADLCVPFPAFAKAKVRGDVRTAMRRIWRYEDRRILARARPDDEESVNELWDSAAGIGAGHGHSSGAGQRLGAGPHRSGAGPRFCPELSLRFDNTYGSQKDVEFALDFASLVEQAGLSVRERLYLTWLMEGWTPKEMAACAHVSTETVKTWRKRTLYKLRSHVEWMDDGE